MYYRINLSPSVGGAGFKTQMTKSMDLKIIGKKLRKFHRLNRRMPTHREICHLFGFKSTASSQFLVGKLLKLNVLQKSENGRLLPGKLFLPQLGFIPAGSSVAVEESFNEPFSLEEYLIDQPETSFVLQVFGDSMKDAGIHPNDLVIVDSARRPKAGDIVVANVDNEFTLKYLQLKRGKPYLKPANQRYKPIYPRISFEISGVVVSVVRKYVN